VPFIRRCFAAGRWVLPGAILVFLPKCPVCLAAYVAFGSGIALSVLTATRLRVVILILCVAALAYFVARRIVAASANGPHSQQ
jgi:hypothetical protein